MTTPPPLPKAQGMLGVRPTPRRARASQSRPYPPPSFAVLVLRRTTPPSAGIAAPFKNTGAAQLLVSSSLQDPFQKCRTTFGSSSVMSTRAVAPRSA
eukprot:11039476-Heterocapsa_arctica.AAC.1